MEKNLRSALVLNESDPLLRFLINRLGLSRLQIVVLVIVLSALSLYGGGAVVSYLIHAHANIIRVFDPEHLFFGLVNTFIFAPIIWSLYLWQPKIIVGTINSLEQNQVILGTEKGNYETFKATMKKTIDNLWSSVLAFVMAFIFILIDSLIVAPGETLQLGRAFFWYYDKYYFILVYIPVLFLSYYAIAMTILQAITTVVAFYISFQRLEVRVHPLAPDEAGGMGALGSLAVRYAMIAVLSGMFASGVTIARIMIGSDWLRANNLFFYALYVFLVPTILVGLLWSAHQAMVRARNTMLLNISNEFERVLSCEEGQELMRLKMSGEYLAELKTRHDLILQTYPVWPISP